MADDEKMVEIKNVGQVEQMVEGICKMINAIRVGDSVSWEISRRAVVDKERTEADPAGGKYHKPGPDTYLYFHIQRKGE